MANMHKLLTGGDTLEKKEHFEEEQTSELMRAVNSLREQISSTENELKALVDKADVEMRRAIAFKGDDKAPGPPGPPIQNPDQLMESSKQANMDAQKCATRLLELQMKLQRSETRLKVEEGVLSRVQVVEVKDCRERMHKERRWALRAKFEMQEQLVYVKNSQKTYDSVQKRALTEQSNVKKQLLGAKVETNGNIEAKLSVDGKTGTLLLDNDVSTKLETITEMQAFLEKLKSQLVVREQVLENAMKLFYDAKQVVEETRNQCRQLAERWNKPLLTFEEPDFCDPLLDLPPRFPCHHKASNNNTTSDDDSLSIQFLHIKPSLVPQ